MAMLCSIIILLNDVALSSITSDIPLILFELFSYFDIPLICFGCYSGNCYVC